MKIIIYVTAVALSAGFFTTSFALNHSFKVVDENGGPLSTVMVTQSSKNPIPISTEDDGYPTANRLYGVSPEITRFTNEEGTVSFPSGDSDVVYRFRKFGSKDKTYELEKNDQRASMIKVILDREVDSSALAEQKPANVWLGTLELPSKEDKVLFKMQCGFCHQQGNEFTHLERSPEDWHSTIQRMIKYGSRLPTYLQELLPKYLSAGYRKLREHPELLPDPSPWQQSLSEYQIIQWPVGDAMSQTHDMLIAKNGLVYVGDNIQDRLYEVNPQTNQITIYKIPHLPGEPNGGLIRSRLDTFPRHDSTSNAHSLAESELDGHIFITPSAQQRLIEFDPQTKSFTLHEMQDGFYPHTIRLDKKDRVWFTLALSNQVAMFDRKADKFTYYDLPSRNLKEKIITKYIKWLYKLMNWGVPLSRWLSIDAESTGVPLAYGIDVTPDGVVWAAQLHSRRIVRIDPNTNEVTPIEVPFAGPRRLRTDAHGNLWISSYGDSLIAKYDPKSNQFKLYDLPVIPKGSETPYSLNVDKQREVVWVTGNQSNTIMALDAKDESWKVFPLPKRTTFTRDVEILEDGSIYSANSNFPSWHIEDGQPTLIKIEKIIREQ